MGRSVAVAPREPWMRITSSTSPGGARQWLMAATAWKRAFDEPIVLPGGKKLITLPDAGNYITKLPKAEHEAPEWLAAWSRPMAAQRCSRGSPSSKH